MANNTNNFNVSEFDCKCGCGFNIIDQRVLHMAQTIRDALGVPVKVNSGCRCEKHNAKVGGKAQSTLKGWPLICPVLSGLKKCSRPFKNFITMGNFLS